MSHYCSPLRYPGGKNCIFSFVSNLFNENHLVGMSYAEPYAGGAGLALRLLFEEYVNHIFINDFDKAIYAFWRTVVDRTDELCSWITDVDVSLDSWHYFQEVQRNSNHADLIELAKATFFLNRTNVSGIIKGGVIGGLSQKGKYKINARFNKDDLIERIQKIANFKHRISVSNLDGLEFIKKIDTREKDIFIYLDPPYYNKAADLYMNFYSKKDHQKLSKHIHKMRNKWIVSYDNTEFILNLYAEKRKLVYNLFQSTSNRIGDEILVFSDKLCFKDSLSKLKSPILL